MGIALLLHAFAATIWVGGMFFALVCLRPVAAELEPAVRLKLWANVLARFLLWVQGASAVLLITGLWMVFAVLGGFANVGLHVHLMLALGLVMMLLAAHVYFAPLSRLRRAAAASEWSEAGRNLNQIRRLVAVNLVLGLTVVAIATGGRYFLR